MSIVQQEKRFHKTMSIFKIAHDINSAASTLGDVNDRSYKERLNSHKDKYINKIVDEVRLHQKGGDN